MWVRVYWGGQSGLASSLIVRVRLWHRVPRCRARDEPSMGFTGSEQTHMKQPKRHPGTKACGTALHEACPGKTRHAAATHCSLAGVMRTKLRHHVGHAASARYLAAVTKWGRLPAVHDFHNARCSLSNTCIAGVLRPQHSHFSIQSHEAGARSP